MTAVDRRPTLSDTARLAGSVRGYLLHVFQLRRSGKTVICGVGRLETGETFALMDDRFVPEFFVRTDDLDSLRTHARGFDVTTQETSLTTMDGAPVARVSCPHVTVLRKLADHVSTAGVRTYEADVHHSRKYRIHHGVRCSIVIAGPWRPGRSVDRVYLNPELSPSDYEPTLAVLAFDIETTEDASEVLAVSLVGTGPAARNRTEEIHIVGEPRTEDPPGLTCHRNEAALLGRFAERVRAIDPDVLTGWNVVGFDLPVLVRRFRAHDIPFNLGRSTDDSWYREGSSWQGSRMVVYGRQVLDALRIVRSTLQRYEDFRLDTVARAVLGRGKTLAAGEDETMPDVILQAYRFDRRAFAEYCLEDARLVRDIIEVNGLMRLTLSRSLLTGLSLEEAWGSVSAFEFLYMSELRKLGMVSPTIGIDRVGGSAAPGGLVLSGQAGLYRHIFVFDFRSLYPSIIRTFNIDPLAFVRARSADTDTVEALTAPNGATFDRRPGILPEILEEFFARRRQAQTEGNALASFTYKILMNSFYGVLGTSACRFASERFAGAITEFGHLLLRRMRQFFQDMGCTVLYGDTDSLFVDAKLPDDVTTGAALARGEELCRFANEALAAYVSERYGVISHLELEFEKYYRRFLLPWSRGGGGMRAKGYAGLEVDDKGETLEIVGMEAARRDWTDLAHSLQRDLLDRLFHDAEPEEIERSVRQLVRALFSGQKDHQLVYHKALRKPVTAYTRTTPPHVKAARLLRKPSGVIHYVMTVAGPQPVGHVSAPLDYEHYVRKQTEAIVRAVAQVCPIDVEAILAGGQGLFPE